jgi:hypothetical protein
VTIIQVPQGHGSDIEGCSLNMTRMMLTARDAEFLQQFQQCAPYHRPSWVEFETDDLKRAPWGHVWYVVKDGVLRFHSADYDSSD